MKVKYKVLTEDIPFVKGSESRIEKLLNKMGEDGWSLCYRSPSGIMVFKQLDES